MAVSSVSSTSSLYGNRNVITGLASGMDTESMIENAISAYRTKINSLQQQRTKTEWKQEAYRSIISKLSTFADKYASYQSTNNLMSTSFFNQAVKTVAQGANASKVSATGKASSDVQIDRVLQLASAASYKLSGSALDRQTASLSSNKVTASAVDSINLDEKMDISTFSGSMTLAYGGSNALSRLTINFDETKTYNSAQDLADEINKQLAEQSVTIGSSVYTGNELLDKVVKAEVDRDGNITFADPKHNNVYISSASASIKETLLGGQDLSTVYDKQVKSLNASNVGNMKKTMSTYQYLVDNSTTMSVTLDGVTKGIRMPTASEIAAKVDDEDLKEQIRNGEALTDPEAQKARDAAFVQALQDQVNSAFGENKLTVSNANGDSAGIKLQFEAAKGSSFSISATKGEALGFGESNQVTSYLNTGKTLGEILGDMSGFTIAKTKDSNGKDTDTDMVDSDGNPMYAFVINGKEVGQFNEKSTLDDVINALNSNSDSGVKVSYSKLTNELTFTAKETGAASTIDFGGEGSLANALFASDKVVGEDGKTTWESKGGTAVEGKDAIFEVSVNGTSLGQMTRSSNTVDLDGMSVTLKGTFGYETDEDGNIKYETEQAKDENGKLLFSVDTGDGQKTQIKATERDGVLEFTDEKTGKTITGELDADGNLTFKNQSGDQVYARIDGQGRLRFDAASSQAMDVTAVLNKTAIQDTKTEPVTFETTSDADKIVDVIKQMVEDYNAMVTEVKNAYYTLPIQRSNGAYYEPLTDDDKDGMSESTIEAWENKAKTGILFGDSDLRNLYNKLTSAISMTGEYGATLRAAGITVNYSNGLSTLAFEEDKFRAALDSDPDKVRDAFTASVESGAKANGLMQSLKAPLDTYGKTTGGKGILVELAGSPLAPSTMYSNTIQTQLDNIDEQISKWEDKMSDQVDYYTTQFSRLEQLIQQMNSQSSYFSQMMGG